MKSLNGLIPAFDAEEMFAQFSSATGGFLNRTNQMVNDLIAKVNPDIQSVHSRQEAELLTIECAFPGYLKDDVSVEADGGTLIVSARVPKENKLDFYGTTDQVREFSLPKGARTEKMTAKFANGVLRVTVPISGTPSVRVTVT